MSEYIEIETELSDDGTAVYIYTNLTLTDGPPETYHTVAEMEEGSPVAQALSVVEGMAQLHLAGQDITITPQPDTPLHAIIHDVSAVLKDFFL